MNKVYYNWDLIDTACRDIYKDISSDGFKPDYIIGLTRGGLIPATILSHRFGVPLETLKVSLRDSTARPRIISQQIEDALHGKEILFVDDINDSGATFNYIKEQWEKAFVGDWHKIWHNTVRFAVIVDNASSLARTDYKYSSINKAEEDVWIVFPWE
jgi:hypoxanthine phosphoribosyltransferase